MYYVVGDSSGNIVSRYDTDFAQYNNIPSGAIEVTEEQWIDSMNNIGKYIVQNGALVLSPPPTDQEQLDATKQKRINYLQGQYASTLAAGFTSSTTGTTYTYFMGKDDTEEWKSLKDAIDLGAFPTAGYALKCADATGKVQYIVHTQAQATTVLQAGANFGMTQLTNLRTKTNDVNAVALASYATLQDAENAVNAVTY